MSLVTEIPPAPSAKALDFFKSQFEFETDCWDVHEAIKSGKVDFVLLDVRGPDSFSKGHVPGAKNLPHRKIVARSMEAYPPDTIFVVYCAGPHCNGAARAAVRLAEIGRPVKVMPGGITGWVDEGFELNTMP